MGEQPDLAGQFFGLAEFCEARLAEDEARANRVQAALDGGWNYFDEVPTELIDPARALREVAAKRAILAAYREALRIQAGFHEVGAEEGRREALELACRAVAAIDSDHSDYRRYWAPEGQA